MMKTVIFFLKVIGKYKIEFRCQIFAYCLMKNHVHLLIKINNNELHNYMRKVGAKYVYWYNRKYDRVGGLFQDRFKSEPVENDDYFLTVLRYIHQNPVKAGICNSAAGYKESSYNEYLNPKPQQITDIDLALNMLGMAQFVEYNNRKNEDSCLEIQRIVRFNDKKAMVLISEISKCNNASEFQALQIHDRNRYLAELKRRGLSIRQIERLTGINRGLVQKA